MWTTQGNTLYKDLEDEVETFEDPQDAARAAGLLNNQEQQFALLLAALVLRIGEVFIPARTLEIAEYDDLKREDHPDGSITFRYEG